MSIRIALKPIKEEEYVVNSEETEKVSLIHVVATEHPIMLYGVDVCSFHEYINCTEIQAAFFIRLDASCITNLQLAVLSVESERESSLTATDAERSEASSRIAMAGRLYPGIYATTNETLNTVKSFFSPASQKCIYDTVAGYVIIQDLLGDSGEIV